VGCRAIILFFACWFVNFDIGKHDNYFSSNAVERISVLKSGEERKSSGH
jgi:hypothetical protein